MKNLNTIKNIETDYSVSTTSAKELVLSKEAVKEIKTLKLSIDLVIASRFYLKIDRQNAAIEALKQWLTIARVVKAVKAEYKLNIVRAKKLHLIYGVEFTTDEMNYCLRLLGSNPKDGIVEAKLIAWMNMKICSATNPRRIHSAYMKHLNPVKTPAATGSDNDDNEGGDNEGGDNGKEPELNEVTLGEVLRAIKYAALNFDASDWNIIEEEVEKHSIIREKLLQNESDENKEIQKTLGDVKNVA